MAPLSLPRRASESTLDGSTSARRTTRRCDYDLRHRAAPRRSGARLVFSVLVLLASLLPAVLAQDSLSQQTPDRAADVSAGAAALEDAVSLRWRQRLARESFENRDLAVVADWADEDDELLNGRGGRGASGDHGAEDAAAPGGSLIKPKATSQTTAATSTISASPLPSPFDDTPSSAFQSPGASDACPRFMSSLLANESFKSCYPLSMMLQTSNSFFDAEKQLLSIVRVLDATCSVQSSYCTALLDEAARNLTQSGNCKTEYDAKQQLVLEAFTGLRAYQMMFAATCLQDPSSDMYCFASAVTNVTDPTDFNFYFMPYGYALPGGSSPTCDWCTQQTMAVFHAASADRTQAVSKVYVAAAQQVNALCGSNFVNATLPAASSRASASTMSTTSRILAVSCVVAWAAALW